VNFDTFLSKGTKIFHNGVKSPEGPQDQTLLFCDSTGSKSLPHESQRTLSDQL